MNIPAKDKQTLEELKINFKQIIEETVKLKGLNIQPIVFIIGMTNHNLMQPKDRHIMILIEGNYQIDLRLKRIPSLPTLITMSEEIFLHPAQAKINT